MKCGICGTVGPDSLNDAQDLLTYEKPQMLHKSPPEAANTPCRFSEMLYLQAWVVAAVLPVDRFLQSKTAHMADYGALRSKQASCSISLYFEHNAFLLPEAFGGGGGAGGGGFPAQGMGRWSQTMTMQ